MARAATDEGAARCGVSAPAAAGVTGGNVADPRETGGGKTPGRGRMPRMSFQPPTDSGRRFSSDLMPACPPKAHRFIEHEA